MGKLSAVTASAVLGTAFFATDVSASDWPQFRGPNAGGRPAKDAPLPDVIGPKKNVIWKTALPPGHSSPIVIGDRIYVSAARKKQLVTIALERSTGRILWEKEALAPKLEQVHKIGSHAQSTPVADDERVISFFGSAGIFCYDRDGKLLWDQPMGPFQNDFGAASSPILVGDMVILCQDHDQSSFLMAIDKRSGKTIWKTDRTDFLRGFCTPVLWDVDGQKQIVVSGTLRVAGYDLKSGKEIWTAHGIARTICSTPVIGDGILFLAGWANGGDPGSPIDVDPFDDVAKARDKNKNGSLEKTELVDHPYFERFTQVDTNGDGSITRAEYERFRELFQKGKNLVMALRPGGKGDVTTSHVVWKNSKQVPFCASPLFHDGLIYTVKNNGVFASLDAKDGKPHKVGRLPDESSYYSSPVIGDGKIYVLSERGTMMVIAAGRDWRLLSTTEFDEPAYATPAIADGRIYVRTNAHLYCFGLDAKK
jgi:outer membrane protein assembly factor BamB